jgi:hypothetical protein
LAPRAAKRMICRSRLLCLHIKVQSGPQSKMPGFAGKTSRPRGGRGEGATCCRDADEKLVPIPRRRAQRSNELLAVRRVAVGTSTASHHSGTKLPVCGLLSSRSIALTPSSFSRC